MKLAVLGASGKTGRAFVEQALAHGHEITAMVRSPEKLGDLAPRMAVLRGDPHRKDDLVPAFSGSDAVITALGAPGPGAHTILGDTARPIVEAMERAGVSRLVLVSAAVLFPDGGALASVLRWTLLRNIAKDSAEMERVARTSALEWTIVRPPRLTNGPLTKTYAVLPDALPNNGRAISRADVACFLLEEIEHPRYPRTLVGIAGGRAP